MNKLIPGTVVSMMVGPIEHFGIVSDQLIGGVPHIISNSKRTGLVCEEPVSIFANGQNLKTYDFSGTLNPSAVVSRARTKIGSAYDLIGWNCEHFIRWALGMKVESPQLRGAAILGLALFGIYCLSKKG